MGCSGMLFPAGNMHIGRTPGTVINSGASFLRQTGHFIATFLSPHARFYLFSCLLWLRSQVRFFYCQSRRNLGL